MNPNTQLKEFLAPYDQKIQTLTMELRGFVTKLIPEANELIWDNYNAVAIAYSKSTKLSDAFCHIAVYSQHVNLGFNRGTELTPTTVQLSGKGKLIRHLQVKTFENFPQSVIEKMIWEAVAISEKRNPQLLDVNESPKSLVMSISPKKNRPG